MTKIKSFKYTMGSCYISAITQAIAINFAPLLFLTFQTSYNVSLVQISFLIAFLFIVQITFDLLTPHFLKVVSVRQVMVLSEFFIGFGLVLLGVLPLILENSYLAILIATTFFGMGAGSIEVILSPILEACPTKHKSFHMSLLHSFFCWGNVVVISLSTVFFALLGVDYWHILTCIWAIIPFFNAVLFAFVPINELVKGNKGITYKALYKNKFFYILLILMLCAGSSEIAISQWASVYCESALNLSKTTGDLIGPLMFAFFMGLSRIAFSFISKKTQIEKALILSAIISFIGYLTVSFASSAFVGFIGCAVCGIGCAFMWPGTYSLALKNIPNGGGIMFSQLAFFGDIGCLAGPLVVGLVSTAFNDSIKIGFLFASIFPILMVISCLLLMQMTRKNTNKILEVEL